MLLAYHVKSDRVHDIELSDKRKWTARDIRDYLKTAGYDVAEAKVVVNRYVEKDKLYGQNLGYVLKEGDTLEFNTVTFDTPALREELRKLGFTEIKAPEVAPECTCGCKCSSSAEDVHPDITLREVCPGVSVGSGKGMLVIEITRR